VITLCDSFPPPLKSPPLYMPSVKRIQKNIYGTDHLKNADLLIEVGMIHDRLNNHALALRCFEEALRLRRKLLAKTHRDIAKALVHVAKLHQCKNDHHKSLPLFQDAINIYRESDGDDTLEECDDTRRHLGLSQIACGDSDSALCTLEICLGFRESKYGSESTKWAEVAYDLGIAKSDAGLFEGAVTLLAKFILLQRGFECCDPKKLSSALISLGKIHLKQRRVDDGMACFEEALGIRKQLSDNEVGIS
jgi:tetratricopeptide (TPR) repeat protein